MVGVVRLVEEKVTRNENPRLGLKWAKKPAWPLEKQPFWRALDLRILSSLWASI
jgi:hypothetical protein